MIYTVTLNPTLDMIVYLDDLDPGNLLQVKASHKYPGGKAINVSRTLHNLNIPSVSTGFLGGYPGKFIYDWFEKRKLEHYFINVDEDSRTNIKVKSQNEETILRGVSPYVPKKDVDDLLYFLSRVREGDIIVMGGSIPDSISHDIYRRIIEICKANKAHFVIDIPPKQTLDALKFGPLLIKPNIDDLAKMFDKDGFDDEDDIIEHGLKCINIGATNAIVSLGDEGSYLFTKDGSVYRSYGVKGKVVNTFSSRDAMIGAFIGLYMKQNDPVSAFKMASASASATAFVEDIATKEEIEDIYEKTIVKKIR